MEDRVGVAEMGARNRRTWMKLVGARCCRSCQADEFTRVLRFVFLWPQEAAFARTTPAEFFFCSVVALPGSQTKKPLSSGMAYGVGQRDWRDEAIEGVLSLYRCTLLSATADNLAGWIPTGYLGLSMLARQCNCRSRPVGLEQIATRSTVYCRAEQTGNNDAPTTASMKSMRQTSAAARALQALGSWRSPAGDPLMAL